MRVDICLNIILNSDGSFNSFIAIAGMGHNQLHYQQYLEDKKSRLQTQRKRANLGEGSWVGVESAIGTNRYAYFTFNA